MEIVVQYSNKAGHYLIGLGLTLIFGGRSLAPPNTLHLGLNFSLPAYLSGRRSLDGIYS